MTNSVALNGGDAAILHGIDAILRRAFGPELDITVHDDNPAEAARRVPFDVHPQLGSLAGRARSRRALRRRLRTPEERELLDRYASADAVVSTGGTYLTDNYNLTPRLRELRLAAALRRPLVLFTQSIGPLRSRRLRRELRAALSDAHLVLLRDETSLMELAQAGVSGPRIAVAADAAFALADPNVLRAAAELRPAADPAQVAISVRAWNHFPNGDGRLRLERYLEAVVGLVQHLVWHRGAKVTFISTCQGVPSYPHDDSAVADAIAGRLPGSVLANVSVSRDPHDSRELMARLGSFDLVVATRMHAAILALAAGAPVLPVTYERKMDDLAAQLGLKQYTHRMDSMSTRALCADAGELLDRGAALRPSLFANVERQRQSALAAGELIREALAA